MVTATAKKPVQTVDSHPAVEAAWAVFAAATARYQAMCGTVEDVDGAVSEKAARHFLAGGALEDEAVVRANARGLLVAKAACDLANKLARISARRPGRSMPQPLKRSPRRSRIWQLPCAESGSCVRICRTAICFSRSSFFAARLRTPLLHLM
jgi:hypothetical protein